MQRRSRSRNPAPRPHGLFGILHRFHAENMMQTSSALAFTTLMSLVPLAAVILAVAGAVPFFDVLVGRLDLPPIRIQRPHLLVLLAGRVARDIVRSNIAVLTIILAGRDRQITSGFVRVPLELTNEYGLAILACIITSTPGTIWMSYEPKERVLLIHVFDLVDESTWIRMIADRYERPLREIFE